MIPLKNEILENGTKNYLKSLSGLKPLEKGEELRLIKDYKENHNIESRNKVITSNLKFACKLASRYRNRGLSFDTLISDANVALIHAIEKFDTSKDVRLITYANWWINERLNKSLRGENEIIECSLPTEYESQTENEDINFQQSMGYFENDFMLCNCAFANEEKEIEEEEQDTILEHLYTVLNDREAEMVKMRYGIEPYNQPLNLEEIALRYGIVKERARQILDKAFVKLRSEAILCENYYHKI